MTYPHITSPLERAITAHALSTWRRIKPTVKSTASTLIFISFSGGVDECYVDTETMQIREIKYEKVVKKDGDFFVDKFTIQIAKPV